MKEFKNVRDALQDYKSVSGNEATARKSHAIQYPRTTKRDQNIKWFTRDDTLGRIPCQSIK